MKYRALWLFGAILALVGASLLFVGPWPDPENDDQWIKVKLADTTTIRVPGGDVSLDFTAPEGVRAWSPIERRGWSSATWSMSWIARRRSNCGRS